MYDRLVKSLKSEKSFAEAIAEQLELEAEVEKVATSKEFSPPGNFDLMFKIGVYGPLIASLHFQLFLGFFKVGFCEFFYFCDFERGRGT